MKKIILLVIALMSLLIIYKAGYFEKKDISKFGLCVQNKMEVDLYANNVMANKAEYKVSEQELDRQSTDGSNRKIFSGKNGDVILIENRYSGESGFRSVDILLSSKRVVKIIDSDTNYIVPPAVDLTSKPIITTNEFYIQNGKICAWSKQNELVDSYGSKNQELLEFIKSAELEANINRSP